jgi:hypothetical protein
MSPLHIPSQFGFDSLGNIVDINYHQHLTSCLAVSSHFLLSDYLPSHLQSHFLGNRVRAASNQELYLVFLEVSRRFYHEQHAYTKLHVLLFDHH